MACVEAGYLGGMCAKMGGMPSKALLESSELSARARGGLEQHGIRLGKVGLDLADWADRGGVRMRPG